MLGTIFLKPLVAQFAIVEEILDDVKDMLDPAAGLGRETLDLLEQGLRLTCRQSGDFIAPDIIGFVSKWKLSY